MEVHEDYWWKGRFLASGFLDHPELTQVIRKVPLDEKDYLRQVNHIQYILKDMFKMHSTAFAVLYHRDT